MVDTAQVVHSIQIHTSGVIEQGARRWRFECDTTPRCTPHGVLYSNALIVEVNADYFADAYLLNRRVDLRVSEKYPFDIISIVGAAE